MTQPPSDPPPFDPHHSLQPVDYPQAGPQPPYPGQPSYPGQPPYPGQPFYPGQPPGQPFYPGQMRNVDQFTSALVRPGTVSVAFVLWLLSALSWPVGTLVRTLAEDGTLAGFGPVMTLFATGCLGVAGVWGAVAFLGGSYHARLGLVGGSMVIGVLALAAAIVAAQDESTGLLSGTVVTLRLVLPVLATVFSFLPGTRYYFSGNTG